MMHEINDMIPISNSHFPNSIYTRKFGKWNSSRLPRESGWVWQAHRHSVVVQSAEIDSLYLWSAERSISTTPEMTSLTQIHWVAVRIHAICSRKYQPQSPQTSKAASIIPSYYSFSLSTFFKNIIQQWIRQQKSKFRCIRLRIPAIYHRQVLNTKHLRDKLYILSTTSFSHWAFPWWAFQPFQT